MERRTAGRNEDGLRKKNHYFSFKRISGKIPKKFAFKAIGTIPKLKKKKKIHKNGLEKTNKKEESFYLLFNFYSRNFQ